MSGPYRTVVADPPWKTHRPKGGWGSSVASSQTLTYPLMGNSEISALPVGEHTSAVCHLYLWTISRHVEAAYDVARSWGFNTDRATLLVWCKKPRGMGPGGHYALTTEYVLFARRGIEGRNPVARMPTSWFEWPRGRHSQKPEAFFDMVERISPGPYLELFARRKRLGWDAWGNEVDSDLEMAA